MSNTNYQYEPLPVPSSWSREERQFAQRLSDILDDIYMRYGRFSEKELSPGLRNYIRSKIDGTALENYSTIQQTADEISAAVRSIVVGGRNILLGTTEPLSASANGFIGSYELAVPHGEISGTEMILAFDWEMTVAGSTSVSAYRESDSGGIMGVAFLDGTSGRANLPCTMPDPLDPFGQVAFYVNGLDGVVRISHVQLERGNIASDWGQADEELVAGSDVSITKDAVRINTPSFVVGRGGDEYMALDAEGGYFPRLSSPQVPPRYSGPAQIYVNSATDTDGMTYFATLYDAIEVLRGRQLDTDVTITVSAFYNDFEAISITGLYGGGSLTIDGANSVVYNAVRVVNCGVPVTLNSLRAKHSDAPLTITACAYVLVNNCAFETTASVAVVVVQRGSTVRLENTNMAAGSYSVRAYEGSRVTLRDCIGTANASSLASFVIGYGTMPSGSTGSVTTTAHQNGYINVSGTTVSRGSGAGTIPSAPATGDVETLYPKETAWHQDIWCEPNQVGFFRQGYTGYGQITGCMWFDMSSLAGMSVAGAKLRLTRKAGVGMTDAVSVRILALGPNCKKRGDTMVRGTVYGTIGSILPGQTKTFTLPASAVEHMITGAIGGICVFATDAAKASGYLWSKNYAQFEGTAGNDNTKPLLTVYL